MTITILVLALFACNEKELVDTAVCECGDTAVEECECE